MSNPDHVYNIQAALKRAAERSIPVSIRFTNGQHVRCNVVNFSGFGATLMVPNLEGMPRAVSIDEIAEIKELPRVAD